MAVEIRPITREEANAWRAHTTRAFAGTGSWEEFEQYVLPSLRFEDTLAAFDGDELVSTAHHEPGPITLPGGKALDTAAVTRVSVAPTHRRRGVLRGMMQQQLTQAHEAGNPLATLWASETPIYGRFGYGLATVGEVWSFTGRPQFAWWAPAQTGSVRFVAKDQAEAVARPIYDAYAASRPGGMPRIDYRWLHLVTEGGEAKGGEQLWVVYRNDQGEPRGYATYKMESRWPDNLPSYRLEVEELCALDPEAERELWRYLLGVDLVREIAAHDMPVDSPIPWLVADFRDLKRRPHDAIYIRVLDPEVVLSSRTYSAEGRLVLQVEDDFLPWAGGTFALEAGTDGGASATRTDATPDLVLKPLALGSILLGAVPPSVLAAAGQIEERTDGALRRADAIFRSPVAPHCLYHF